MMRCAYVSRPRVCGKSPMPPSPQVQAGVADLVIDFVESELGIDLTGWQRAFLEQTYSVTPRTE